MGKNKKKSEPTMSKPELSKRLLALMSNHPGESYNYKQLAMRLQVKSMDMKRQISEVLRELGEKGELEEISTGRYKMRQRGAYITGEVELTAKGSAYIISNESKEDVFVAFPNLKHALNGDKVKVLVYARSRDRRPEGEVVEILERKKGTFVGVVQRSANYAFLIPTGKQLPYDVFIPTEHLNGAENGDKVVVKIKDWPENQKNPVGEVIEVLAEKLESWEMALPACLKLAYLPKPGLIRLRLTGRGQNRSEVEACVNTESAKLEAILGEDILDEEDTPIEILIGELLKKKNLTLSTAESCTGGSIAARITSVAGSSEYFKGSIVAYANEVKTELLGVSMETLEKRGAVSEETVIEMVKGAMKALKTDCAVATSGIAGPSGGTEEKPVGTVWIAAAYKSEICTMKQETNRGREMNVERASNNALLLLRKLVK
jgi:PncC family amidohydrolase